MEGFAELGEAAVQAQSGAAKTRLHSDMSRDVSSQRYDPFPEMSQHDDANTKNNKVLTSIENMCQVAGASADDHRELLSIVGAFTSVEFKKFRVEQYMRMRHAMMADDAVQMMRRVVADMLRCIRMYGIA